MSAAAYRKWQQANSRFLAAALAQLRQQLVAHAHPHAPEPSPEKPRGAADPLAELRAAMPAPSAIDRLIALFGLTAFEADVLLLCAAVELDAAFPLLCSEAQGDPQRTYPTFSLALAALPEPSWEALSPAAPLRAWRLLELTESRHRLLTTAPLRIDESILHFLLGSAHVDERLATIVAVSPPVYEIAPSHHAVAAEITAFWSEERRASRPVAVQLCGDDASARRDVACAVSELLGMELRVLPALALPALASELEPFLRLCERESILRDALLLLDADELDGNDPAREQAVLSVIGRARGLLLVSTRRHRPAPAGEELVFDVRRPTLPEQRELWLGEARRHGKALQEQISRLVLQFDMSAASIHATWRAALAQKGERLAHAKPAELGEALWDACTRSVRPRLEHLAQRLEPSAEWEDLVLPALQQRILEAIAVQVQHRALVYEKWGFLQKGTRGLSLVALFAGASGTGKTMAAELLARRLRLDLYRIDLSAVVSKFIGETEKNLRQIFDAAEEGGAILLFDEADALFGKRSEVKDSHDRHANIEVSYLLQRLEAYRGLAILTSNLKEALDSAFLRRLRFIVNFPFPSAGERELIWKRIYPADTPTRELAYEKLARLNVSGGQIRNIALQGAFLAAAAGEPVTMRHLERAARDEYLKLEKTITEPEIRAWT